MPKGNPKTAERNRQAKWNRDPGNRNGGQKGKTEENDDELQATAMEDPDHFADSQRPAAGLTQETSERV